MMECPGAPRRHSVHRRLGRRRRDRGRSRGRPDGPDGRWPHLYDFITGTLAGLDVDSVDAMLVGRAVKRPGREVV
jgi:hypothetical protein